ncbi:2-polyprenylphenol 6-hydroxylase [Pelagibacterium xiamenense]|uniref:2-polyprenylphenol 6-hydroxylase n=1 Tax=Pelagibacterium xiamenense TaxID=2901140 RepID=UPI001E61EC52|nr:2-polyprenylphenol 6-hydroxylase [Pelagibacterium xiamenense]MCD7058530.1 2-polyprenylphenol 6-hydroxylase [Pelagibacterium xiamenense]
MFAYLRLLRAGFILAREGAFSLAENQPLPPSARFAVKCARLIEKRDVRKTGRVTRLANALNRLGPTYVKFGQLLATRRDIVGPDVAADLAQLQDAMPPFDARLVPGLLEEALGEDAAALTDISEPIAAASIAQVHKATLTLSDGTTRTVAVKLLRPGIVQRFHRDLQGMRAATRALETLVPSARRFNGQRVVDTLTRSATLEMDLRMEAAAISEMADNNAEDDGFRVPEVYWAQTARSVLTTNWIEAIPVRDSEAIAKAGLAGSELAITLIQSFLKHAIRDGFFHADMHPGNLFADPRTGAIVAVDLGIMGRIGLPERRFLAQILHGFITRDYKRIAQMHFDIGYVPADQSVDDFAQALRAIGEPLVGRGADEISMARVLGQLLETTEVFNMSARPELVLLQKNMVLVEGTARMLDPRFNMWTAAEPVVGDWVRRQVGPLGHIDRARESFGEIAGLFARVPGLAARAERVLAQIEADQQRARRRDRVMVALKWGALIALALAIALMAATLLGG